MTITKTFNSLGVKSRSLTGDKITIEEILDKTITVCDFKSTESKYSRDGTCLHMQIEYEGVKRMVFTGSNVLREDLELIPGDGFPFTTVIVKIPFKDDKKFFFKFT